MSETANAPGVHDHVDRLVLVVLASGLTFPILGIRWGLLTLVGLLALWGVSVVVFKRDWFYLQDGRLEHQNPLRRRAVRLSEVRRVRREWVPYRGIDFVELEGPGVTISIPINPKTEKLRHEVGGGLQPWVLQSASESARSVLEAAQR